MRISRVLARRATRAALGLALVALAACATRQGPAPTWEGLELQPSKRFDVVYLQPGADFSVYRSVILDPAQVAFAKDWDPNRDVRGVSRRLNAEDLQAIKDGLAGIVREIFAEELEKGGYSLVDAPAYDVLRLTPAIVDLYINAPDRMEPGRSTTYTTDAGRMTLVLEVRDSVTGDLLARVVDAKGGRDTGMMTITNRVTNTAEARRAVRSWAEGLRKGFDRVTGKTS